MTDAVIIALIGAGSTTVLGLATLAVGVINGRKTDSVGKKADEIHALADGNLSKVSAKLDIANEKIDGLNKVAAIKGKPKPPK